MTIAPEMLGSAVAFLLSGGTVFDVIDPTTSEQRSSPGEDAASSPGDVPIREPAHGLRLLSGPPFAQCPPW